MSRGPRSRARKPPEAPPPPPPTFSSQASAVHQLLGRAIALSDGVAAEMAWLEQEAGVTMAGPRSMKDAAQVLMLRRMCIASIEMVVQEAWRLRFWFEQEERSGPPPQAPPADASSRWPGTPCEWNASVWNPLAPADPEPGPRNYASVYLS